MKFRLGPAKPKFPWSLWWWTTATDNPTTCEYSAYSLTKQRSGGRANPMGLKITWEEDRNDIFGNILPFDMFVDGMRTYTWLCYYKNSGLWRFKGATLYNENPTRATREEAEADAIAWWAAKHLEDL